MYDLAIIGAGPAGLSASVYATRYGLKNIVIGAIPGGLINDSHEIGNWLGTEKISGFEFGQKAQAHVKSFGTEIKEAMIEKITRQEDLFLLHLSDDGIVEAKTVLLATGTHRRHLNVPGEKELAGRGVSYCSTCDGFFYRDKIVAVAGGNDSAAAAALHLAGVAQKVYIIYRGAALRAESFWTEAIAKENKIEIIYNTNILKINGEQKLGDVEMDQDYVGSKILKLDGLFIEIGSDPSVDLAQQLQIEVDQTNYIKVGADQKTSINGVWAAGDATNGSDKFKQAITAAAEGAIAINSIQKYLKANK